MSLQLLTILSPTTPCIPILLLTALSRDRSRKWPLSLRGTVSVLGFSFKTQTRQCIRPNRVPHCFVYGLVIRFQLLSTTSLNVAVAFCYGQTSAPVRLGLSPNCWCALSGAHRGRDKGIFAPPSEPDWPISGIRLSSWWLVSKGDQPTHPGRRLGWSAE